MTAAASFLDFGLLSAYAASIKEKEKYPVAVIGSDLGGLTCAAYLSKAGFPVTVFERHHKPGGYATTFRRGKFVFEVSLHAMAASVNATHTIRNELGLLEKIELIDL